MIKKTINTKSVQSVNHFKSLPRGQAGVIPIITKGHGGEIRVDKEAGRGAELLIVLQVQILEVSR